MSESMIIKRLTGTNEWETVSVKDISKGDRIKMYLTKADAANDKVHLDCIVEDRPFIDGKGNISSIRIKPYKEYLDEEKAKKK